jgi:hypothetical protein
LLLALYNERKHPWKRLLESEQDTTVTEIKEDIKQMEGIQQTIEELVEASMESNEWPSDTDHSFRENKKWPGELKQLFMPNNEWPKELKQLLVDIMLSTQGQALQIGKGKMIFTGKAMNQFAKQTLEKLKESNLIPAVTQEHLSKLPPETILKTMREQMQRNPILFVQVLKELMPQLSQIPADLLSLAMRKIKEIVMGQGTSEDLAQREISGLLLNFHSEQGIIQTIKELVEESMESHERPCAEKPYMALELD